MGIERYQGWLLLAHSHFEDQWSFLQNEVVRLASKQPETYRSHPTTKKQATIKKLVFEVIPSDPVNRLWPPGNTLGPENRSWRRAKFGQRYRLFFRFDSASKIVVYGWMNDENSFRARNSRTDAHSVFAALLNSGNPSSARDDLLEASNSLQ